MENEERLDLLANGKMSTALIKMGVPTMVGLMVSALYSIVDAYWVGKLGTIATAAVSVVYPLSTVGIMVGLLFGSGANSVVARLLGQKRYQEVREYSSTAVYSTMAMIGSLVVVMLIFVNPILRFLGTTPDCMDFAREYAIIFIIGLFFNSFNMCLNNLIVAEGNSSLSMIAMFIGGGFNLVMDPILIFNFNMGVKGAAIATLISRIISFSIYLWYALGEKSHISLDIKDVKIDTVHIVEIIKIGLPIALFQLINGISASIVNNLAGAYGESAQAALGIVNRIVFLETNILYGFFKGFSPVVGYNFGARRMDRVKEATRLSLVWATVAMTIIGGILVIFRHPVILMFNKESVDVMNIGAFALAVYGISYITYGYQIIVGNLFIAIGEARLGGMLSLGKGLWYILYLFLLERIFGITGIVFAQLATDITGTLITAIVYRRFKSGGRLELKSA